MMTRFDPETTPDDFVACQRLLDALLPPHRLRALLQAAGTPASALGLTVAEMTQNPEIALTDKQAERVQEAARSKLPSSFLNQARALSVWVIAASDPAYPRHLLPFADAPMLLFVRGTILPEDGNAAAIVGSRRATAYGIAQAERFARSFVEHGLSLVSGGAIGIDTAAHRGALAGGGRTLSVLGCGVDIAYPSENRALFAQIADHGALLSEFALGARPEPWRFPARNRIIAGIARATLLVETPTESGAMITARDAAQYGRDVWAVPGLVGSGNRSQGCHRLIQDGAGLADGPEDVLRALGIAVTGDIEAEVGLPRKAIRTAGGSGRRKVSAESPVVDSLPWTQPTLEAADQPALPVDLSAQEAALVAAFDGEPRHVDEALFVAGLTASEAAVALTLLEMKGLLRRQPGNLYVRLR